MGPKARQFFSRILSIFRYRVLRTQIFFFSISLLITYNKRKRSFVAVEKCHSGQIGFTLGLDTNLDRVVLVENTIVLAIKPEKKKKSNEIKCGKEVKLHNCLSFCQSAIRGYFLLPFKYQNYTLIIMAFKICLSRMCFQIFWGNIPATSFKIYWENQKFFLEHLYIKRVVLSREYGIEFSTLIPCNNCQESPIIEKECISM